MAKAMSLIPINRRQLPTLCAILLLVALPAAAAEPTLARLSFWVPPQRLAEFETAYQAQVLPILTKHGLAASATRGRATADSVFSRLFEVETPTAIPTIKKALQETRPGSRRCSTWAPPLKRLDRTASYVIALDSTQRRREPAE